MTVDFEPVPILRTLNQHGVRYVVIGGIAATLHGSSVTTGDLDICYERSRDNLVRLAAALKAIDARPRGWPADVPFILDDGTLRNGDTFTFETRHGHFDCLGTPQATSGYVDLEKQAVATEIADGVAIRISSIDDLIRMKRAAGRPKDLFAVEHLEALKDLLAD